MIDKIRKEILKKRDILEKLNPEEDTSVMKLNIEIDRLEEEIKKEINCKAESFWDMHKFEVLENKELIKVFKYTIFKNLKLVNEYKKSKFYYEKNFYNEEDKMVYNVILRKIKSKDKEKILEINDGVEK